MCKTAGFSSNFLNKDHGKKEQKKFKP